MVRAGLVSSLTRLGTEQAIFPLALNMYKRELASDEVSKIKAVPILDQARQFIDGISEIQIVPFCDLFSVQQRRKLCSADRRYNISEHVPSLISLNKVRTQLKIVHAGLPKKPVFDQLRKSIGLLLEYYKDHFERLCGAKNQEQIAALLEPKAWAIGAGLQYFYIAPTQELSSSEVALTQLLLRTTDGERVKKNAGAFGNSPCGRFNDLHIKPAQVGWYIEGIKRHNSAGSWFQYWNTRYPVYVPAVSIKLSHVDAQLDLNSEHELEKIKPLLTSAPLSGRQYLRNHIKISPLIDDGVDLAIVFEAMSVVYNWRQHFSISECAQKLLLIEQNNLVDDVASWPQGLVEHSGCYAKEYNRIPAYFKAFKALIPDYSHEKALREIPDILNKVCPYSFTSLLFAALGAGMEDLTGANIMLCPTDETKTVFYFRVIDAKRAHFHPIFQKGDIHYPYIAIILLTMPNMFNKVSAQFFEELMSENPLDQVFGYSAFQYEDDEKDREEAVSGKFTQRDIQSGISEGVQHWHADTLTEKLRVVKKAHDMWRESPDMTNEQFAAGLQPALMLYTRTVAYPWLKDTHNIGWAINKAFSAATYRSPPFEKVFLGDAFNKLQFNYDPESRKQIVDLSKSHIVNDTLLGPISLFKLLRSFSHGNLDYQQDATLTIQEAIVSLVRAINPKEYSLSDLQWREIYQRWQQKLSFLEGFEDVAVESKIRAAVQIVMGGNPEPLNCIDPEPDAVFNCIRWPDIVDRFDDRFGNLVDESCSPRDVSPRADDMSPKLSRRTSRSNSFRTILSPRRPKEKGVSSSSPRGVNSVSPRKRGSGSFSPRSASISKMQTSPRKQHQVVREILQIAVGADIVFGSKLRLIGCPISEDSYIKKLLANCAQVTSVNVSNSRCITDDAFYTMSQMGAIEEVIVSNTSIGVLTRNIQFSASLTKLVARNCKNLSHAMLRIEGLSHLDFSGCVNLQTLDVGKSSALQYLNLAGCYNLPEGYITRVLLESPHLMMVVLPSSRLKYNLRAFVEFAYRQNRLKEKPKQTQFLNCINQGGEVNFYGVDFSEPVLRDFVTTLAYSMPNSVVSRLDFTGCMILKKSILSYVASLSSVVSFSCSELFQRRDFAHPTSVGTFINKEKLKALLQLPNGQVMGVGQNGSVRIWDCEKRKIEWDRGIGVKPIVDVAVTPQGGFFVLTPYALYVKRYFSSELEKISDAHHNSRKIIVINDQWLAVLGEKLTVFKKHQDTFDQEITIEYPGLYDAVAGYGNRVAVITHHQSDKAKSSSENRVFTSSDMTIFETTTQNFQRVKNKKIKGYVVSPVFVEKDEVVFAEGKNVWRWSLAKTYDARLLFVAQKKVRKITLMPMGQLVVLTNENGLQWCRWDVSQEAQMRSDPLVTAPISHVYSSNKGCLVYASAGEIVKCNARALTIALNFRNQFGDLFNIEQVDSLNIIVRFSGSDQEQVWQSFVRFAQRFFGDYQPQILTGESVALKFFSSEQCENTIQLLNSLFTPARRPVQTRIVKGHSEMALDRPKI